MSDKKVPMKKKPASTGKKMPPAKGAKMGKIKNLDDVQKYRKEKYGV